MLLEANVSKASLVLGCQKIEDQRTMKGGDDNFITYVVQIFANHSFTECSCLQWGNLIFQTQNIKELLFFYEID